MLRIEQDMLVRQLRLCATLIYDAQGMADPALSALDFVMSDFE